MTYEIGDRVLLVVNNPDGNDDLSYGCMGTVLFDDGEEDNWLFVRWDEEITGGHTCDGRCEDGHGWNVPRDDVQPYKEVEINDEDIAELSELCSFIGMV